MTLLASCGQNVELELGGEEEAEEARDEADGREEEREVELGLLEGVFTAAENMAWVPLALSSCVICCLLMSPMSEFNSASVMPPRSIICLRNGSPLTIF